MATEMVNAVIHFRHQVAQETPKVFALVEF